MSRCSIQAFVPEEHKSGSRRSRITVRPPHSPVRLPSHPRCALAASGSAASASSRRPERLFAALSCEGRSCAVNRPRRRHRGGDGGRRRGRRRDARLVATLYGRRHRHASHMCGGHSSRRTDGSQFDPVRARFGGHGGGGADRRCASAWREVASVAAARFTSTSHRRRCAARARRAFAPLAPSREGFLF